MMRYSSSSSSSSISFVDCETLGYEILPIFCLQVDSPSPLPNESGHSFSVSAICLRVSVLSLTQFSRRSSASPVNCFPQWIGTNTFHRPTSLRLRSWYEGSHNQNNCDYDFRLSIHI